MTIYQLVWGASGYSAEQVRYFSPEHLSDAAVRFSELVLELDREPSVWAGYVHLNRLPDSICPDGAGMLAWTKTSDERPTVEGETSPEAVAA